uniref:homeodomain-interacting protein kinase 2-like n=1 Tax=Semicossyphus pulcher TaxID=241346 RepID=UPI0037E7F264
MGNRPVTISENYKIVSVLGKGCFGQVMKCVKQDTEETVAVKVLKTRTSKLGDVREVRMLEKLRCLDPDKSSIIRCHETFHHIDQTCMVFEILDISILDYMNQSGKKTVPLNGIKTIVKDVATALKALKGVGLIHTDIKLDNVMLVDHQRRPFRAKLIDFGLTLEKSEARGGVTVQPLWYRSPEVLLGNRFTAAIDIWSLGIMMARMLVGFTPFPGKHQYDVLRYIIDLLGEPPKRLLNGGLTTEKFFKKTHKYYLLTHWKFKQENSTEVAEWSDCVELLKQMLRMNPRERITPSKILADPFITSSYLSNRNSSRCASKLPHGVTIDQPAVQMEDAPKQSRAISPQDEQNSPESLNATDDRDLVSEPANDDNDSGVEMEFIADSVLNQKSKLIDSLHTPEVTDPKKKRRKKGVRGFFSTMRRRFLSCFPGRAIQTE